MVVRVAQLAATVLVTWLIVDRVGLGVAELGAVDASTWVPAPMPLLIASVLLLGGYFLSGAIWGRIVRDLGGPTLPAAESVSLFMIANLGRYVPGKVWQIAGLAALGRARGVPPATGAGAAVIGQGIALVAASAVGLGALLAGPESYRPWGAAAAGVLGLVLLACGVPGVFARLARLWFRVAHTEQPRGLRGAHGALWLGLYGVNWAVYALAFWVFTLSLEPAAPMLPVASAFAAAYVLGYLVVFAPAGLGPREGFLVAFLTPYFGPGPSGVIAVVARLWTTLVEVVPAAAFWSRHVAHTPGGPPPGEAGEGTP